MSLQTLALALGIPIAGKMVASAIQAVDSAEFKQLFTANVEEKATEPPRTSPEERLERFANKLRSWLEQHGIQPPYQISLSTKSSQHGSIGDLTKGVPNGGTSNGDGGTSNGDRALPGSHLNGPKAIGDRPLGGETATVTGFQADEIRQLLAQSPESMATLSEILQELKWLASPLSSDQPSISITEDSANIHY